MLIMKSNKIASILFTALILFVFGKVQGKFENIKTYLNNYEVSKITELKRSSDTKFDTIDREERSIVVKAFGKKFTLDLSIYFPRTDVSVSHFSNSSNITTSFLDLNIRIYQGQVRNVNGSFVIGSFSKKNLFRGYIIIDEVYCIEPNYKNKSVIVYKFSDVISQGCTKQAEGNGLDCTKTKYFKPWNSTYLQTSLKYLPYTWPYDKYLKLYITSEANETKSKRFRKEKFNMIEQTNSIEEKENTKESDHMHKMRNSTATSHHLDHKEQKKTYGISTDHHHNKLKNINGTENDDDDDDDDDDDNDNSHNTISETDQYSNRHTSRKKKDSHSKINVLVSEYPRSQNQTDFNNTVNLEKDAQNEIGLLKNDSFDKIGKIGNLKLPLRVLKSNESTGLVNITSKSSIMDVTKNTDSLLKNSSIFEFPEMRKETSYATNPKLRDEQVKKEEKRSVKSALSKKLSKKPIHLECNVQFVLDQTISQKFDDQMVDVIKDIFIQMTLINKILSKVTLQRKSNPFHLHIEAEDIVIYGDNIESPFNFESDLKYFIKNYNPIKKTCLTIGLVYKNLKSGEFSQGYAPGDGSGACSKSRNVIIVSHGNSKTPAPMALYFSALMRGITRSIGANDADTACSKGPIPNPMKVLNDYLLAKHITPGKQLSIFTECNVKEIEKALNNTECLIQTNEPSCGDAIVDEGEECDCGPDYICGSLDPCCTPHHHWTPGHSSISRGCKLTKKAKCSSSQQCCDFCDITKEKMVCHNSPDPCNIGRCDGKSADCPTNTNLTNGKICKHSQPEPLVCKNMKCGQGLCSGYNLKPCTCSPKTGKECVFCCLKDGKCQAAGSELQLWNGKDYPVADGTGCLGGKCSKGNCSAKNRKRQKLNERPPRLPALVDGALINVATSYSIICLSFFLMTLHFLGRCFI